MADIKGRVGTPGALTPARLPDKEVEAITTLMRSVYERDSGKKSTVFQPIMFRTQVVAGTYYYIKVMVHDGDAPMCVHLKVLNELDPKKVVLSLETFKEDMALDSPLDYF